MRIKEDLATQYKYQKHPCDGNIVRDGRTLRGTVVHTQFLFRELVDTTIKPVKKDTIFLADSSYVLFLDAQVSPEQEENCLERIPLRDIIPFEDSIFSKGLHRLDSISEQVASQENISPNDSTNTFNLQERSTKNEEEQNPDYLTENPNLHKWRVFEFYNRTKEISKLEFVQAKQQLLTSEEQCNCLPLRFSPSIGEFDISIECPDRLYPWYFTEVRVGYGAFSNSFAPTEEQSQNAVQIEIASGVRFGESKEWGIGLAYLSGIPGYNTFQNATANRPAVVLHTRYQTPGPITNFLGICMKPFFYGQLGATIDDASIKLGNFSLGGEGGCDRCSATIRDLEASGSLPEADFSLPLTFGAGLGVEIPVTGFMDIAFDVGWRSVGFGDEIPLVGIVDVPTLRRVNFLFFRTGITF